MASRARKRHALVKSPSFCGPLPARKTGRRGGGLEGHDAAPVLTLSPVSLAGPQVFGRYRRGVSPPDLAVRKRPRKVGLDQPERGDDYA